MSWKTYFLIWPWNKKKPTQPTQNTHTTWNHPFLPFYSVWNRKLWDGWKPSAAENKVQKWLDQNLYLLKFSCLYLCDWRVNHLKSFSILETIFEFKLTRNKEESAFCGSWKLKCIPLNQNLIRTMDAGFPSIYIQGNNIFCTYGCNRFLLW